MYTSIKTILNTIYTKKKLINYYSMYNCSNIFIYKYCNNIDWRK